MVAQVFDPVGNDGGILQFWTPSQSRVGHEGHELTLTLSDLSLHCSCESAVYRKKNDTHPTDDNHCKHGRGFAIHVWPIIATAIGSTV